MKTLVAAVVACAFLAGCSSDRQNAADVAPEPKTVKVRYLVQGTATSARTTYATPTGTEQGSPAVPLMNKSGTEGLFYEFPRGKSLYMSAQNSGYGDITCKITVNGKTVAENTSSGRFSIAACSATS